MGVVLTFVVKCVKFFIPQHATIIKPNSIALDLGWHANEFDNFSEDELFSVSNSILQLACRFQ